MSNNKINITMTMGSKNIPGGMIGYWSEQMKIKRNGQNRKRPVTAKEKAKGKRRK